MRWKIVAATGSAQSHWSRDSTEYGLQVVEGVGEPLRELSEK
jgi:hypothetical protein